MTPAQLYLDLLKNCITNYAFIDEEPPIHGYTKDQIRELRRVGGDWSLYRGLSMIGLVRMQNLQSCIETVLKENISGDFIETGVWRGGACIFMRGALKAYEDQTRNVWVADCFDGVPPPDPKYPHDDGNTLHYARECLAVSQAQVMENFKKYDMLDERVRFLPGLFKDTLHVAPIEKLAILRLDGDLYGSTWEALDALYPKLSTGGFCIVDDYGLPPCRQAVEDYCEKHSVKDTLEQIDALSAYWRKS